MSWCRPGDESSNSAGKQGERRAVRPGHLPLQTLHPGTLFHSGICAQMILRVQEASPATATFLFTDVEGSTQLLRVHRAEYAAILAEHHRILREQFAAHGGREIDNQTA